MLTINRILFPIDFSARCYAFAPYVASVAAKFRSEVTLLHALDLHDPFGYGAASSTVVYGACTEELKAQRQAVLAEFEKEIFSTLDTHRLVVQGEPAQCIVSYAEEHGCDIVFIPTHGHGRFRRLLLGSVTAKVLHDSQLPVWTSAHSDSPKADGSCTQACIRNIVCAIDDSYDSLRVLHAADDMARSYGAHVQLLHAIGAPEADPEYEGHDTFRQLLFDVATESLAAKQREAGTSFDTKICYGGVAAVVKVAAAASRADLIVIGRGRLQHLFGRLRTNVSAIIRESPCPVLSI